MTTDAAANPVPPRHQVTSEVRISGHGAPTAAALLTFLQRVPADAVIAVFDYSRHGRSHDLRATWTTDLPDAPDAPGDSADDEAAPDIEPTPDPTPANTTTVVINTYDTAARGGRIHTGGEPFVAPDISGYLE
ncbi:hypothetical protein ACFWGN_16255 [Oerskovia sp. NPDC060338]|uniref:hypothetical protein n=1 Tax=Oerskovia sp. NPDC060338 TaxID=3347100 RepID=UPI0036461A03